MSADAWALHLVRREDGGRTTGERLLVVAALHPHAVTGLHPVRMRVPGVGKKNDRTGNGVKEKEPFC